MEQEPKLPEEEKFIDDPEENLRLENEFLKMKMMAESRGIFGGNIDNGIPVVGNQFLKNVMNLKERKR